MFFLWTFFRIKIILYVNLLLLAFSVLRVDLMYMIRTENANSSKFTYRIILIRKKIHKKNIDNATQDAA